MSAERWRRWDESTLSWEYADGSDLDPDVVAVEGWKPPPVVCNCGHPEGAHCGGPFRDECRGALCPCVRFKNPKDGTP